MSKAIKNCQRTDGFWNVSMHDESNFGGKETSGTALLYMAWHGGVLTDCWTEKIPASLVGSMECYGERCRSP